MIFWGHTVSCALAGHDACQVFPPVTRFALHRRLLTLRPCGTIFKVPLNELTESRPAILSILIILFILSKGHFEKFPASSKNVLSTTDYTDNTDENPRSRSLYPCNPCNPWLKMNYSNCPGEIFASVRDAAVLFHG